LKARKTALHWAAERNCPKIMRLLLEKGADPDSKDMVRNNLDHISISDRWEEHLYSYVQNSVIKIVLK